MVDARLLREQSQELAEKMAATEKAAYAAAGGPFNLGSPKQLQEVLYERLQLPVLGKTPKGQPSTAEDVLEQLAESYELPRLVLDYRGLTKLKSTYTDKLPIGHRSQEPSAFTPRTTKPSRRRGGCRRRTRICRTFRFARPKAAASARRSSRRPASSCWPPTTRRSSSGSWRTCRATRACWPPSRATRTCTARRRPRCSTRRSTRSRPISGARRRPSTSG